MHNDGHCLGANERGLGTASDGLGLFWVCFHLSAPYCVHVCPNRRCVFSCSRPCSQPCSPVAYLLPWGGVEADKEMESICKRLTKESHGEQTWTFWSKKDSVKSKSDEGGRNRYAHKCVICKGPGAAAAQLQMGNATYVVVAIATLRDGPSTKAKKVGELHVGAQVTAIAALEMDGHQRIQISATPPQWASTVVNTGKALMELVPTQQESVQQESVVNPVHESNGMQTVQMTCPAGCGPGSSIQAEINGTMMSLTVPEGVTGGQPFQVQVAAPAED